MSRIRPILNLFQAGKVPPFGFSQRNHRGIDLMAQQIFILHAQPLIDQRAAALRDVNGNRLFVAGLLIAEALTLPMRSFSRVLAKAANRLT
jgi:hypothetical protein